MELINCVYLSSPFSKCVKKEYFQDPLNSLIKYLLRQSNLPVNMVSQCPMVAPTSRLAMGIVFLLDC